jgi:hypothetical protein
LNSSLGGDIYDAASKVKLGFPSNCVQDQQGNNYEGQVKVDLFFIDSKMINWRAMPNRFTGQLTTTVNVSGLSTYQSETVHFETYNAVYFDIKTSNGQPLYIKEKEFVNLTIPVSVNTGYGQDTYFWEIQNGVWVNTYQIQDAQVSSGYYNA